MHLDYEFLAPLGGDGRCELLRGRRRRTGAPVLIKRARHASGAEAAALQREAAVAASLTSAATLLPRLIDHPAPPLLVMEDPGGELLSTLLAGPRLALETVLAIALRVTGTLAELHPRGLVHQALRPEAILCRTVDLQAWLVDLGEVGEADATTRHSRAPAVPARLVYLAPEQTGRMDQPVDARSDLYALGVVLYEMLTGAPPFRSDDALELIHWQLAGTPAEPSRLEARVPAVLSALVMKLLAKRPEERYQSAAGLAQDLAVCARDWAALGDVPAFPLGRRDIGERLVVSQKLYGREREVHVLLEAFERACSG